MGWTTCTTAWGAGSLWQSRYQAKLVDEERYLGQLIAYVHLNPVRAVMVADPVDHLLGGHREIVMRIRTPLVDVDDVLLCYGESKRAARRSYLSAMAAGRCLFVWTRNSREF